MSREKIFKLIFVIYLILLCAFVFTSLDALVSLNISIVPQFSQMGSCLLAISLVLFSFNKGVNEFYILFLWWMAYYTIAYFLAPHYDIGVTGYFRLTWFINAFLISYICCRNIENPKKLITVAFVAIIVINMYFTYLNIFNRVVSVNIEEIGVSNIVFWSFCSIPAVFLINNPLYRNTLITIIAIICLFTMKRSAFIALLLILFFYYLSSKRIKRKFVNNNKALVYAVCCIGLIVLVYKFQDQFLEIWNRNVNRINSIQEDRGSNRLTVWEDVINAFDYNSIAEWIIGNGMGSTLFKAKHTTAHNDFLTVLFEFGIVGVIFYIIFIVKVVKRMILFWKSYSEYTMCLVSSVIILLVVGNVGDMFTCYSYLAYIMILLGAIEARVSIGKI